MKFLVNMCNHSQIGQRSLEDPVGIMIHQLRALGHDAEWRTANDQLVTGPGHYNVMVEGFTQAAIDFIKHYHAQGARFIILATEEPTPKGFNHGIDPEMRLRQKNFPEAAQYADAIWYLVPGKFTHDWYNQCKPAHYVELGYAPSLVRFDNTQQPKYEFGFYGSLTRRRMQILKRLAKKTRKETAVRLMGDFRTQQERDATMRQAKVIILVRKFEKMGLVSSSRCNTALSIGRPVLGEPHDLSEEWEGIVRFSDSLESFYSEALLYAAAWKGLHATQFERFRDKLSPDLCIGRALRATGIARESQPHFSVGAPEVAYSSPSLTFDPSQMETVSGASEAGDRPEAKDDAEANHRAIAA